VLRQSNRLEKYKLIPLSGAQLVNNDETLALAGTPGDVQERRRIEIRLRKSSIHEASVAPVKPPASTKPKAPLQPRPVTPRPYAPPAAQKGTPAVETNRSSWWSTFAH
jgi:hypothetical protein